MSIFNIPSPVQQLKSDFLTEKGVELWVKRDDLIHEEISGNKWRKLKYNFDEAKNKKHETVLTFGGAFSNHLIATAIAAKEKQFKSIGIVRGEKPKNFSNTLNACKKYGMLLEFISREEYRRKEEEAFLLKLEEKHGKHYRIPEGGANSLGAKGCAEILEEDFFKTNFVAVAAGTGTTAAGLLSAIDKSQLLVFPVLKGVSYLKEEVLKHSINREKERNLHFLSDYHFGGYAKISEELVDFVNAFYTTYHLKLDMVYTAKLFYGLFDLMKKNYFNTGSKILAIHTGGLQGNAGMIERHGINLF